MELDAKNHLYGLYRCPYNYDNPKDCPLYEERVKCESFEDWYIFINKLSSSNILSIYCDHKNCLCKKENK